MKKKSLSKLFIAFIFLVFSITSCNKQPINDYSNDKRYQIYQLALSDGYEGTYQEWLESISGKDGTNGLDGKDGASVLTGKGEPLQSSGKEGDSYINLDSWNYYIKINGEWIIQGNIRGLNGANGSNGNDGLDGNSIISIVKTESNGLIDTYTITYSDGTVSKFTVTNGSQGIQGIQGKTGADGHTPVVEIDPNGFWCVDGQSTGIKAQGEKGDDGISIISTIIDDNGDLIVYFSNGTFENAGHVKDVDQLIVDFYLSDTLVNTQVVGYGKKIAEPIINGATVTNWYIDKGLTKPWVFYGYVVTENMCLYADYTSKTSSYLFNDICNLCFHIFRST